MKKPMEELEEKNREEAIIYYEKRDEVEQAWRDYESVVVSREPAKILVEMPIMEENEIQNHSFPF